MFRRIADWVTNHPKMFLAVFGAIAILSAFNVPKITFDFTPQQLFRASGDELEFREAFAERFGREDNAYFVLVEAPDIYDPAVLQPLRDVTLAIRAQTDIENAESIATVDVPRTGGDVGVLSTESVVPRKGDISPDVATQLRKIGDGEPLVEGRFVNANGSRAVLLIWIDRSVTGIDQLAQVTEAIHQAVESGGFPQNATFRFGGVPHLRVEIVDNLKIQQMTFIPLTGVAYFLVLLFLFRRLSGVLPPLSVVAIASLMITTVMVWTDSAVNIINNIIPSLVFIIGISDSIHMLVRDAEETEAGHSRKEAVKRMIIFTGAACLLTSTTTAVGFGSLLAADTEILQDFGWQAATGVMFAYLVTLFVLPSILIFLPPVKRKNPDSDAEPFLEKWLARVGEKALDHPVVFIIGGTIVTSVFVAFCFRVDVDTTLLEVYTEDHPSYETTAVLEEDFGGILPFEIALEGAESDAFKDPAIFQKVRQIQEFARQQKGVLASDSFVDFHQTARAALLGDPNERDVMPDSREQVEQIQLLIAGPPDEKTGINRMVTPDFRHARVLLRVPDSGSKAQLALGETLTNEMARIFEGTDIKYRVTGDAFVASKSLNSFILDLFTSLLLAMVIIFAMMTFVFKSLKLGVISIVPNVVPLVLTFGYMGMANINLNTTTVIIFAISLGLAVDDTIHFLARFREEWKGDNAREAVLGAYNGAGRAIMLTSVMLLIGLTVLASSDFLPTRQFAILTSFTIAGAILGDLLILPPILYLAYRKKKPLGSDTTVAGNSE